MKDKYYTPEIGEFHVGFEYEFSYDKLNYKKQTYDGSQVLKSKSYYDDHGCEYDAVEDDLKYIRVKYLDKKDIESLGFISKELKYWEEETGEIIYKKDNYTLVFWKNAYKSDYKTNVYIRQETGLGQHCFKGEIKNKSELKKILKQLGI